MSPYNKLYKKYINRGRTTAMSLTDLKKVRLFNVFCLFWFCLVLLMVFEDIYVYGYVQYYDVISCLVMTLFLVVINVLHKNGKHKLAYISYVLGIIVLTFYFTNFVYQGKLLEYYYILAPAVSVVFLEDKWFNNSILLVSFLLMQIPNMILNHYPTLVFNDTSVVFIYLGTNYMIRFFKSINQENETLLKNKNHELTVLNRQKSQFFTNVSHEIRTPLTLLDGTLDKLNTTDLSKENVTEILQASKNQTGKISRIVDDVLDLSRLDMDSFDLQLRSIDLCSLVKKIYANFLSAYTQKNVVLSLDIPTYSLYASVDEKYFERVLYNLLSNALKYTLKGGNVSLSLVVLEEEVHILVQDDGIGLHPEDIQYITDRFYQVDNDINRTGGSGIGLNYVQEIIHMHGADFRIESKINEGSTFTIVLPKDDVPEIAHVIDTELIARDEVDLFTSSSVEASILIVEDNKEMQAYLQSLMPQGQCILADNGQEALDIIAKHTIDIVITDYMMPVMDGLALVEAMRSMNMDIPIIMLTARSDNESRLKSLKAGANDYIHKPFDRQELLVRIHNLLHFYHSRVEYNDKIVSETSDITESDFMKKIEEYIVRNIDSQNIKQDEISAAFAVSKSTLYRKIKSTTGLSPNAFIKEIRLQEARKIAESNPSILLKQLARKVGFSHLTHFSRMYEERFGSKPWNE